MTFSWSSTFHPVKFGPSDPGLAFYSPASSSPNICSLIFRPCICRPLITVHLPFSGLEFCHPKYFTYTYIGESGVVWSWGCRKVMGCHGERGSASLGVQWAEPRWGVRGKDPWSWWYFSTEHTFLRCPWACSGSWSDRSDQTEAYIWHRCYFECKRLKGAVNSVQSRNKRMMVTSTCK